MDIALRNLEQLWSHAQCLPKIKPVNSPSRTDAGEAHETTPAAEELLVGRACCGRGNQPPTPWCSHCVKLSILMQAILIKFSESRRE